MINTTSNEEVIYFDPEGAKKYPYITYVEKISTPCQPSDRALKGICQPYFNL